MKTNEKEAKKNWSKINAKNMDNVEYVEPSAHGHSSLVAIVFEINFDVQTNDYISFAIL